MSNKDLFGTPEEQKPNSGIFELTRDTFDIPLPSKGLVYPEGHPLHKQESCSLMELTSIEEHIFYDKVRIRNGTVIDDVVQASFYDKRINVKTLLAGDRDAMFFAMRGISFDQFYKFDAACPKCDAKTEINFDLQGQLKLNALDLEKVQQAEPYTNKFAFKLPKSGLNIVFKYGTVLDNIDIEREKKDRRKAGISSNKDTVFELAKLIVSIETEQSPAKIAQVVEHLSTRDTIALRRAMKLGECGVDTTYDFKCSSPDCGHEEKSSLPLTATFFFPHLGV